MFVYKDGQTIAEKPEEKNSLENNIVGVARELVKAISYWKPEHRKILVMCLTKINWRVPNNSNIVELSKSEILEVLNVEIESKEQSRYLREVFKRFQDASLIECQDENTEWYFDRGYLIARVKTKTRGKITVEFPNSYMELLEDLVQKENYLKMWSSDQFHFKSKFTFALYDALQLRYDFSHTVNYIGFTTRQLKQIFGISEKEYIRKKDGQFDRTVFEKKVLDVAITEINSANGMMMIQSNGRNRNGKLMYFEKTKLDGYVKEYIFKVRMFPKWVDNDQIIDQDEQQKIEELIPDREETEPKNNKKVNTVSEEDSILPWNQK